MLRVKDDGMGFEEAKPKRRIGHGLTNMQARAEGVGGGLEVISIRQQGTTLTAWMPYIRRRKSMPDQYYSSDMEKAAQRGEPSAVWRAGQERRLGYDQRYGRESIRGNVLVNGTGMGAYQARLAEDAELIVGLDIEFPRLLEAKEE